jgi:hypothetical protein
MYLLYVDDSGSVGNAADKYIILAGVSVFERDPYWLSSELDQIAEKLMPHDPVNLEFHGSEILSGRKMWRGIAKQTRIDAFKEALRLLSNHPKVRLFGVVVDKQHVSPDDPMEYAFEQVISRFDMMLLRHHQRNDTQRGVLIFDKSTYETSIQNLARHFRFNGHRWGNLRNISEVPLFVNSKVSRMIQFSDLVAYALRRFYTNSEEEYFNIIKNKFDHHGGVLHGLRHFISESLNCGCFACLQTNNV